MAYDSFPCYTYPNLFLVKKFRNFGQKKHAYKLGRNLAREYGTREIYA